MLALADAALRAGWPVIVDAVFQDLAERHACAALAAKHGVRFDGVWLTAPAEQLRERVTARRGDASDATADVVALQLRRAVPVEDWPSLATDDGVNATVAAARRLLNI